MRVRTEGTMRKAVGLKVNGIYRTNFSSVNTCIGYRKATTDAHPYKALIRRKREHRNQRVQNVKPLIGSSTVRLHDFWTHRVTGWSSTSSVTISNTPSGWQKPTYSGELAAFATGDTAIGACIPAGNSWFDPLVNISPVNPYKDFVLAKAFSAIREADVQLANYAIELPQLFASLANPFKGLWKMQNIIREWWLRGHPILCPDELVRYFNRPGKVFSPKSLKRLPKTSIREASNRWLELQFGLLPAWDDTMAIIEEIDNVIETGDKVNFGKGGYRDTQKRVSGRGFTSINDGVIHYTWNYEQYSSYSSKVYFKHLVEMDRLSRMGLTPANVFDVIWEATPWSFVIDWIYGIGDWLHTLQKLPQIHLLGNYVTRSDVIKLYVRTTHAAFSSYTMPVTGTYAYQNIARGRTINHILPEYPQPNLRWFNVTRSLNALSLVIQKLTRGK